MCGSRISIFMTWGQVRVKTSSFKIHGVMSLNSIPSQKIAIERLFLRYPVWLATAVQMACVLTYDALDLTLGRVN